MKSMQKTIISGWEKKSEESLSPLFSPFLPILSIGCTCATNVQPRPLSSAMLHGRERERERERDKRRKIRTKKKFLCSSISVLKFSTLFNPLDSV
jgi:hypothetical protein